MPRRRSRPGAPQLHENAPNNIVFEWTRRRQGRDRRRDRRRRGRRPPAHRQPAPHPEPDGDPRRHRLVQPGHRRVHDLDVEPDAAHPAAPAGRLRDRHPRAQDPRASARMSAARSAPRSSATRTTALCCSPARRSAVGRSSGSKAAGRAIRARSTAATTSPTSRSPARATARSPACGSRRWPTSAAACRPSARASRRRSTPASCRAATRSRTSTAEVTGVYTNTTFVDAYRGAGRPEATYVIERAMDLFAAEIGMDRAEIRRKNFIAPDTVPVREPVRPRAPPRAAPRSTSTRATTSRRWTRRSTMVGYYDLEWPRRRRASAASTSGVGLSRPTSRCAASRRRSGSAPSARAGAPRCGNRPTSRCT